jgi:hypothetical protein
MPRLPDRFDLWVRLARACPRPERQVDYVLGALVALPEWYFLNVGTKENPLPAAGEIEGASYLLVFSDADRVAEIAEQIGPPASDYPGPVIAVPTLRALDWCVDERPMQCAGLLINPGEDAAAIPLERVAAFAREWKARPPSGFWIPNLTTAEEDFWREHGL